MDWDFLTADELFGRILFAGLFGFLLAMARRVARGKA